MAVKLGTQDQHLVLVSNISNFVIFIPHSSQSTELIALGRVYMCVCVHAFVGVCEGVCVLQEYLNIFSVSSCFVRG